MKKLNELKTGEKGRINKFQGNSGIKRHLMGLGFVKGAKLEVTKIAPLGDPLEVKIRNTHISMRKEEAKNIELKT